MSGKTLGSKHVRVLAGKGKPFKVTIRRKLIAYSYSRLSVGRSWWEDDCVTEANRRKCSRNKRLS